MQVLTKEKSYYESTFFKWKQRIGFGISDYACNLAYLLANTYLLFYYTNVAGLPNAAVGIMFVITKFIDGCTDLMAGVLIDRTDTKWGRYRPWLFVGAPVLAVGMIMLFSVPLGWGDMPKMAWAYISYIIFSLGYTIVQAPMSAMVPTLSNNPIERTNIVTSRMAFANLGTLTSSLFTLPLVYHFAGVLDSDGFEIASSAAKAAGYRNTNIVLGIIVVVILWLCFFNTTEVNAVVVNKEQSKLSLSQILHDVIDVLKCKYVVIQYFHVFFLFTAVLGMYAAIQYYFTYILQDVSAMGLCLSILTIGTAVTMLFSAAANRWFSKKTLLLFGTALDLVAYIILFFTKDVTVVYVAVLLLAIGLGFRQNIFLSMFSDCCDAVEYQAKRSLAGLACSLSGFVNKLASAAASAIVAGLLAWGSFDGTQTMEQVMGNAKALSAINISFGGVSAICTAACIIVICFYTLDKDYPEIKRVLDERRAAAARKEQNSNE